MKIGIFSGSFDPIHCGHAMMANYLAQFTELDAVWLMPSPLNPLKATLPPASYHHRFKMCSIVADKCRGVVVSDFESRLEIPSFTNRTLCRLRDEFPGDEFYLVIGSDNWLEFRKWRDWQKIVCEFKIIVYPRPGYEIDDESLPDSLILLRDAPVALISSTFIRRALVEDKNMSYFIDKDVEEYIKDNELYGYEQ